MCIRDRSGTTIKTTENTYPQNSKGVVIGNTNIMNDDFLVVGNFVFDKSKQEKLVKDTNWKEEFKLD